MSGLGVFLGAAVRNVEQQDKLPLVGLLIVTILIVMAIAAPWLSPYTQQEMFAPLLPPSCDHILGTNDLGYDLWTELLYGARFSLGLGFASAGLACLIGAFFGVLAGYWKRARFLIMRLIDVFLCVPRFPLIVLMAAFVRPGFPTLLLFFVLFGWPSVARVICAAVLAEQQKEYITAAHAIGVGHRRILLVHLLPAALPVLVARFVGEIQHVVMAESGLSFLGLGDPAMRSWGMTLSHASRYPAILLTDTWQWWAMPPGSAITLLCLALALVGLLFDASGNPASRSGR